MAEPFDTIDTKIAQYSTYIETYQDGFYTTNGRYLQLKRTHTVAPDGTATIPDNLDDLPSDESQGWSAIVAMPAQLEMCLSVHKYEGPLGFGWLLLVFLTVDSAEWLRTIDVGPEGRDRDWVEIVEDF